METVTCAICEKHRVKLVVGAEMHRLSVLRFDGVVARLFNHVPEGELFRDES